MIGRKVKISALLLVNLLGVSACVNTAPNGGTSKQDVTLRFAAQVGDAETACDQTFSNFGLSGTDAQVLDLRMYISNVRLINDAGAEVPVELDQDGLWQYEDIALLDFENGEGGCSDVGTADTNSSIVGSVAEGAYTGIAFDIGVPFDLNHDDLAAAPSPLNVNALWWVWAVGYKFVTIDLESGAGNQFSFHVGSTGCESDGPQDPPVSACSNPNRATIHLTGFDPTKDTVVFDLAELFAGTDITQDTPDTATGCQSFTDDAAECGSLFANIGLDYDSGECTNDCMGQTCFRVETGAARGERSFNTQRITQGGEIHACADCHGPTGAGLIGPDIRGTTADHMYEHGHGGGPHPAGIKFEHLTESHCMDIASYLNGLCMEDSECVLDSGDGHVHQH